MRSSTCNKWLGRLASLLMAFVIGTTLVFAQTKTVTGTVVDELGEPMIGVNVVVVGTTNGATTDIDGNFSIQNVANNATLKVTFIGYKEENISVAGKSSFQIALQEDRDELDEVVVIGYGTVKKRDLTGSVASVGSDQLTQNPVSDVAQALQGKLPGVSITAQDGRPGAEMSIRVRGGGSISQSNDPLFIVDGFPVSSISDIPADQIVSIDVLKDASSTAIYGARGANGVILVTTKGADKDRISVSYSGYFQAKTLAKSLDVMSAQDYILDQWAFGSSIGYGDKVAQYFGLGSAYGNHWNDYANVEAHNWTEDLLRTAYSWNHNLNLAGGSEKTKFTLSVNYTDDEGLKEKSGYSRFSTNFKLKQNITKGLDFDLDARYTEFKTTGNESWTNGRGTVLSSAYQYRPILNPLGKDDATLFGLGESYVRQGFSPVDYNNDVDNIRKVNAIRGTAALSYNPIKGLTFRSEIGINKRWNKTQYYEAGLTRNYKYAKLTQGDSSNMRWVNTINYEVQGLGKDNNLSFLLGHEVTDSDSFTSTITGAGYGQNFTMDNVFGMIQMTDPVWGDDGFTSNIGVPNRTVSFFGRMNYSYKSRYLLTATLRADGSSKFAPNNRWGYFPAAAFAWRVSDEPWMEPVQDWLSNLKLRLSYGTSGADGISASNWRETWQSGTVNYNNQTVGTYQPAGMKANPDLKWETTISRNIGLDYGFWGGKLNGTVDVYWNTTEDLLMRQQIDSSTGYSFQFQNIGQTSNKGFEVALNYDIVRTKNFNLAVNATYNYNHNNIDELANGEDIKYGSNWASNSTKPGDHYILREGCPVGTLIGWESLGFYTTDDFDFVNGEYRLKAGVPDINATITGATKRPSHIKVPEGQGAFPGVLKVADTNGDGVCDDDDITEIGEITSRHTGGFGITASYKGIDFSANFTYQIGGKVFNCAAAVAGFGYQNENYLGRNRFAFMSNAYRTFDVQNGELVPVSDPAALDALNAKADMATPYNEFGVTSSNWLEDASYLRMSTLTVGYTLPKTLIKKTVLENARVYFTGGNLFCLNSYRGYDPEVNANTNQNSTGYPTLGGDFGGYPRARTFTFGLKVEF